MLAILSLCPCKLLLWSFVAQIKILSCLELRESLREQVDFSYVFDYAFSILSAKVADWGIPRRYKENQQELHDKLVARGRRYFELNNGASLQDYYGDRFPRAYKDVRLFRQCQEMRKR